MSNARKLQTEIDRVMKKVDEGVELFDEIWEKVYSAEQQNQKEKHEVDLKKEIKKLQRLRDQIKSWIGSSDVKDKDNLLEARKLIETKMEQFKICEKETKTKTYSKEGLARTEKISPEEQAKLDTCKWVGDMIDRLQQLVEDKDVEIERLSAGKGKKTNRHLIEEHNEFITSHKFHINKLEGVMRLVMNDLLDHELVDDLKEDIEYYIDSHDDEEYMQSYDEEYFYDTLGLEDIGVVNVDRVTQAQSSSKSASSKNDDASSSNSSLKEKKSKKKANSGTMIPLTIGRARTKKDDKESDVKESTTPTKKAPPANGSLVMGPSPTAPAARALPPVSTNGGASMAAILKREGEQEKERQKQQQAREQQRLFQEQQAARQAEILRQDQIRQQKEEQLRHQQQQQAAQQEVLKRQQEAVLKQQVQAEQQRQQQEAAKKQAQQAVQQQLQQQRSQSSTPASIQGGSIDGLLTAGLGGLSLGDKSNNGGSPTANISPHIQGNDAPIGSPKSGGFDATASYLGALDESFLHCPSIADSERQRTYIPRNPYPTPSSYPTNPNQIFENPAIFEKLGTDCLFFIFYYAQGTYQQYLAARELKKQSWRYHKKYMTWFQRHEEPKVTTEDYEQGTYVYFDYESGWCQRIKSDFRFEYSYLEDSLQ